MFKVVSDKKRVSVNIDSSFVVPGKPSMVEPDTAYTETTVWLRFKHSFSAEAYRNFPQAVEDIIALAIVEQNKHVTDSDAMRVAHGIANRINIEMERLSD